MYHNTSCSVERRSLDRVRREARQHFKVSFGELFMQRCIPARLHTIEWNIRMQVLMGKDKRLETFHEAGGGEA